MWQGQGSVFPFSHLSAHFASFGQPQAAAKTFVTPTQIVNAPMKAIVIPIFFNIFCLLSDLLRVTKVLDSDYYFLQLQSFDFPEQWLHGQPSGHSHAPAIADLISTGTFVKPIPNTKANTIMNVIYNFLIVTITSLHNTMFMTETNEGTTYKVPPISHIRLFYK